MLSLGEIEFVTICAKNGEKINLSLRSEKKEWDASIIVRNILKDIGFGGGHKDMAGGIILDIEKFNEDDILKKVANILFE